MTEFLLIGSFAAFVMTAMPAITEYATKRMQAVSAARMVAWQRTVWLPEAVGREEGLGAAGSIRKTDEELSRDIGRHIFRDRADPIVSVHDEETGEFQSKAVKLSPRTDFTISTVNVNPPVVTNVIDTVITEVRKVQLGVIGDSDITRSLGRFTFIGGGYFRNEVKVNHSVTNFKPLPKATMTEQVTMLTEPWNAGGTVREEQKIQGLTPMKLLDLPFYQQLRSGLHQVGYQVKGVLPAFDINNLLFGFTPGDAFEKSPLDRFELTRDRDNPGEDNINRFRWYRSFPPPPTVNTLP